MATLTSTFNYCTPTSATFTTTVYETVLPAACETGVWDATYTITDYCLGSCQGYVKPMFPPGFVLSTVHCPVCPTPEVVITCPTYAPAVPTAPGILPPPVVGGNGVTAACVNCATPTITVYPTGGPAAPGAPGAGAPGAGAPGAGAPGAGAPGAGAPGAGAPGAGAPGAGAPGAGGAGVQCTTVGCPGVAAPTGGVITKPAGGAPTNPPVVVAGATSVSRSLGLISGLAAIAGYIYLL